MNFSLINRSQLAFPLLIEIPKRNIILPAGNSSVARAIPRELGDVVIAFPFQVVSAGETPTLPYPLSVRLSASKRQGCLPSDPLRRRCRIALCGRHQWHNPRRSRRQLGRLGGRGYVRCRQRRSYPSVTPTGLGRSGLSLPRCSAQRRSAE